MTKRRPHRADTQAARPAAGQAVLIAVGITALAPFAQPIPPIDPYTIRFVGILVAACAWLWAWALEPTHFRLQRRLVLAAGAVASATVVSALASYSPGVALTWGAEGGLMAAPAWLALLVVFLFAASVRPTARLMSTLRLLFVWGALSSVMVLWERASSAPQVTGGFGNANFAGAALVALVPLALFFASDESQRRYRSWWYYLVAALIGAVLAAGSLANMIALAVVVVGALLLAPGSLLGIERGVARRVVLVVVAAGLVAALVLGVSLATDILPKSVDDFSSARVLGTTATTRLEMWKMAGAMFADHPVLGVGPGAMQHESQGYLTERLLELESGGYTDYRVLTKDPHSLPLLAVASLGIVGLAALLWLAAEWLRRFLSLLAAGDRESRSWALRCALGLSVAASLTALLFMPWSVSFGPLVPLLAGLAIAGSAKDAETPDRPTPAAIRLTVTVLVTLTVAWLVGAAMYGESRIASAKGQSEPGLARDAYAAAARVQPTRPYVAYEALYAQGFLASEGLADIEAYRAAVDAAPAEVIGNAGFLANLVQPSLDEAYFSGRTDLTWERERIERAAEAAPNHPDVVLEEAHLALLEGDLSAAKALLARTARYSPNAPRHLVYSYYLALATDDEAAAQALLPRIEAEGPGHSRVAKGWNR